MKALGNILVQVKCYYDYDDNSNNVQWLELDRYSINLTLISTCAEL